MQEYSDHTFQTRRCEGSDGGGAAVVFEPLARLWGYPVLQVRFEELPLGGGGAHIGDLNISIFLQGLHDGPQLGPP